MAVFMLLLAGKNWSAFAKKFGIYHIEIFLFSYQFQPRYITAEVSLTKCMMHNPSILLKWLFKQTIECLTEGKKRLATDCPFLLQKSFRKTTTPLS